MEWAIWRIGPKDLRASFDTFVPVMPLLIAKRFRRVKSLEKIILSPVIMQLGSPNAINLYISPNIVRRSINDIWSLPMNQIFALITQHTASTGSNHDVGMRFRIRKNTVITPTNLVERVSSVRPLGSLLSKDR